MDEAQQLENQRLIALKEARAQHEAGHWSVPMLWRIVRGDHPQEFMAYSAKRMAVKERACLILLDAARDRRPDDPVVWTEEPLTLRLDKLKAEGASQQADEAAWIAYRKSGSAVNFPVMSGSTQWGGDGDRRGPYGHEDLPWRGK